MSSAQRRSRPRLTDQLTHEPHRFEFFQAVRVLEKWLDTPVGQVAQPGQPALQFRNSVQQGFPAAEIEALAIEEASSDEPADADRRVVPRSVAVTPAFMGLLGVCGTLPLHYTEAVVRQIGLRRDEGARAFLDIFQHRSVSLFYEAWCKHRLSIQHERGAAQHFAACLRALAGGEMARRPGALGEQGGALAPQVPAFFAGLMQRRAVSSDQLARALSAYFQVPVCVHDFQGKWYTLPSDAHLVLGGIGSATQLGRSAVLGGRVWQRDLRVRLRIGPLSRALLDRFLPGSEQARALAAFVQRLTGASLAYEVNLCMAAAEVGGVSLHARAADGGARLGWSTYLSTRPSTIDRADVRYDLDVPS